MITRAHLCAVRPYDFMALQAPVNRGRRQNETDRSGGHRHRVVRPAVFNSATISFTPFTANSILSFAGTGDVHTHAPPAVPFTVAVFENGGFVDIFSGTAPVVPNNLVLSSLGPIAFAQAEVSGIRFQTTDPGQFHDFTGETITFNSPSPAPPIATPEPSTLLLLASGQSDLWGSGRDLRT